VPQIGETVGRYVIEETLGEGGMGRVYRALDPSLGRRVALKVLIADGKNETARGEAAARMMREARAAAAFMHPNVVAIYDVGQVEGAPFIAMELVTGTTLRACVGNAEISGTQKLAWLIDVARGLGAAHRAGLVHRDIKPENVMITADGVVKVLDFGIARRTEASAVEGSTPTQPAHLASVTADGLAVGTPQYMAPEQLHASPLDGRCDQYAWGVMAYEMFSGQLPWGAKDGAQLVAAVLAAPVKPLRDVVRSIDPRLSRVIARAMERDRDVRFSSMTELVEALSSTDSRPQQAATIIIQAGEAPDSSAETTELVRTPPAQVQESVLPVPTPRVESARKTARTGSPLEDGARAVASSIASAVGTLVAGVIGAPKAERPRTRDEESPIASELITDLESRFRALESHAGGREPDPSSLAVPEELEARFRELEERERNR
jgi:serine/threonine protein kinase